VEITYVGLYLPQSSGSNERKGKAFSDGIGFDNTAVHTFVAVRIRIYSILGGIITALVCAVRSVDAVQEIIERTLSYRVCNVDIVG
jgi:hypothetical protein